MKLLHFSAVALIGLALLSAAPSNASTLPYAGGDKPDNATLILANSRGSSTPGAGRAPSASNAGARTAPIAPQASTSAAAPTRATRPAEAARPPAQPLPDRAATIARQTGQNSITVQRPEGKSTRYDLTGRPHYDRGRAERVPTPHVHQQRTETHTAPSGRSSTMTKTESTRPMTESDFRTVRRVIQNQQNGGRDGRAK